MSTTTILTVLAGLVAVAAAAIYFFGIPPETKRAMEKQALKTMGENKMSYMAKGTSSLGRTYPFNPVFIDEPVITNHCPHTNNPPRLHQQNPHHRRRKRQKPKERPRQRRRRHRQQPHRRSRRRDRRPPHKSADRSLIRVLCRPSREAGLGVGPGYSQVGDGSDYGDAARCS